MTSGPRRDERRFATLRWTVFHTVYGIVSGPGAEEGEELNSTQIISSLVTVGTFPKTRQSVLQGGWAWAGKISSIRESLTSSGESAPGRDGNLDTWRPAAMRLAFQTV